MSADPYRPPAAHVADPLSVEEYIEVTWAHAAKVWWSLMWRALLFGTLAGGSFAFVVGAILGAIGTPTQAIARIASWASAVVGIPIGIWVVRMVLRKSWSGFRIALVPTHRK